MNIRNLVLTLLAATALSGCYSGYGYRGGSGDYYYGSPSVDYYGYGGYGYDHGYGYGGYGYPYGHYGYYPGYYPGYYYPPWYTHNPRPRPRPDYPPRNDSGVIPDSGVRYESRARGALDRSRLNRAAPQVAAPSQGPYPSRVPSRVPQVRSGLDTRGVPSPSPPPSRTQPPPAPRFESRAAPAEPRFQSRPSRMDSGGRNPVRSGSSSRERDRGRVHNP